MSSSSKLAGSLATGAFLALVALGISILAGEVAARLHGPLGLSRLNVAGAMAMGLAMTAVLALDSFAWARRMPWGWGAALAVLLAVSVLAIGPASACPSRAWMLSATVLGAVFGLAVASTRLAIAWRVVAGLLLVVAALALGPQPVCGKVRGVLVDMR